MLFVCSLYPRLVYVRGTYACICVVRVHVRVYVSYVHALARACMRVCVYVYVCVCGEGGARVCTYVVYTDGWMDGCKCVLRVCAARTTERVSLRETGTGLSSA